MTERRRPIRYIAGLALFSCLSSLGMAATESSAQRRVAESGAVLQEILHAKDRRIPEDLLSKAQCVGVVPALKRAAFMVGARYGKGVMVCRTAWGWSAPSTIRISGGSFGFQIGAGETDVVFAVMNRRGMHDLMKDKFTLGGDAAAMAGPLGRSAQAETDAMMRAEILAYSRSRGVFAGISLEGATLWPGHADNRAMYGRNVTPREILSGRVRRPASARLLYAELSRYAGAGARRRVRSTRSARA
ncbi:MAG TPA: lipid-binding SYLF domain-containing protein [Bryobacteraceae bacterium]|nr:lipid-binding SYLF domain-containing protein [Bryobacteraceae bacterium]